MSVRIVTDSAGDLPRETAEQLDITVVPVTVFFGEEAYLDGVEMDAETFFQRLPNSPQLPRTSQPSVAQFVDVYTKLVDEGHDILSVHVSGKLSGTLNSARLAREEFGKGNIEVLDAEGASLGVGLIALEAARKAQAGGSLDEVTAAAQDAVRSMRVFFVLDTLEYLVKGGRISKTQGLVGGLLNVKPILHITDGEVHPFQRVRSRAKALQRIRELVREGGPYAEIGVLYATDPDEAAALASDVADLAPGMPVVVGRIGPGIGAHAGPGAVGVALRQASPA
jgi:DegV family protein with EDD domain